jgi:hypothetical protein
MIPYMNDDLVAKWLRNLDHKLSFPETDFYIYLFRSSTQVKFCIIEGSRTTTLESHRKLSS